MAELKQWSEGTSIPTQSFDSWAYLEALKKAKEERPWYQKAYTTAVEKPFSWLHEKIEVPGAAIVTSPWSPKVAGTEQLPWLEREMAEYKKWQAPKFVKGVSEFAVSLPLFMIPYGGLSIAGSKAIAGAARLAGLAKTAKAIEGLGQILPTAEKILAYPITKPARVVGGAMKKAITEEVPLKILSAGEKGITVGPIKLPTIAKMAEEGFTSKHIVRLTERWKGVPGLEWIVRKIDSSILASTPEARLTISYGRMLDMGDSSTNLLMVELFSKATPREVRALFGIDDLGFATKVKAKGNFSTDMDSIIRFPGRYELSSEQLAWIKTANETWQPIRNALREAGILERELATEAPEGGYLGRLVVGWFDKETGKTINVRSGSLFTRSIEPKVKPRIIEDYRDAVTAGYRYQIDPLTTMSIRMRQAFKSLIDKDYIGTMLAQPGFRTTGAKALPQRMARDEAAKQFKNTRFVLERLRRASRGERLTPQSLRAIRGRNEDIANLLGANPSSGEINAATKRLNKQLSQDRILALNARQKATRALEWTRRPALVEEGTVYQPGFGNRIAPKEVADYINRTMGDVGSAWVAKLSQAQGVVRMLQTGIDLGPYFLQGAPTLFTQPKIWATTVDKTMQGLFDEKSFYALLAQPVHRDALAKLIPHGFVLNTAEMVEAAPTLAKIPLLGGTFTRWAKWFNFAIDGGRLFEAEALMALPSVKSAGDAGVRAIVDHLGKKWGVMSTRWLGITEGQRQVENAVLFYASRWTRSGFALMKDAISRGGMEGALARDTLGRMMLGMTMAYYGFCKALNQEPNFDPSTGKFMTIQIGTDHVGFGGMYIALARFAGNTLRTLAENPKAFVTTVDTRDNPLTKFVRGRVAPLTGSAIDIIVGKTYLGEPVDSPLNFGKHVAIRNLTPFWLSGILEGLVGAQPMPSAQAAPLEFLGAREWPTQAWERRNDLRENYAQMEFGKSWNELRVLDRRNLEKKHADLKDITEEAWTQSIERGRPSQIAYGQWREEHDAVNQQYEQALWDLQAQVDKGQKTPYDFRISAQKLGMARAFALDHIDAKSEYADVIAAFNEPRVEPEVTPQFEDQAYEIWTKLMYSGDLEKGVDDYDFAEADKRRQWFIGTFGQEAYQYVRERLQSGRDIPRLMQEYYNAQEVMRPYWQVRDQIINILGEPRTPSQEQRVNSAISKIRKRMRQTNPEIERFYQLFYSR